MRFLVHFYIIALLLLWAVAGYVFFIRPCMNVTGASSKPAIGDKLSPRRRRLCGRCWQLLRRRRLRLY